MMLRLLRKLKVLKVLNITQKIVFNNSYIYIPIHSEIGFDNMNISEPWMLDILRYLSLSDKEVVIDVGVNIGQTLIKLKSIYPNISYIGFEPNASCLHYIKSLREVNNWNNIDIIPVGISENRTFASLEYYADTSVDASASIIPNYRLGSKVYKREIISLMDVESVKYLWGNKKISLIKIDVEGSELGVIQSFKDIIKRDRPFIFLEILPIYTDDNIDRWDSQNEIEKIVKALDYKIYRVHKDEKNRFKILECLNKIGIHDKISYCDYLLVSKSVVLPFK